MIRRFLIAGAATAAGLLGMLAAAPPAGAGTSVGCDGNTCSASLDQFITYKGDYSPHGTSHLQVTEDPPPCLWVPKGDAITGSQYIIGQFPNPDPGLPFDIYNSVQQAKQLLANPKPGTWYNLPINPAAGPAGFQACLKLPAFYFVPPGGAPPMPPIPDRILAEYAYNHMSIPAPTLTTSPANKGWVNLASFVWTNSPPRRQISATLGNQTVTVVAVPASTALTSSAGLPFTGGCGPNGSHYPQGHAPTTGPGTPPDCGVLWQTPTTGATITATVTWDVTWTPGGQPPLPAIPMTGTSPPIAVAQIQSINGR